MHGERQSGERSVSALLGLSGYLYVAHIIVRLA